MKLATLAAALALTFNVAAADSYTPSDNLQCYSLPTRNKVCVDAGRITVDPETKNPVAPLVMSTPDYKSITVGHSLEVVCSHGKPAWAALRDPHGTRYAAGDMASSPASTRAMAADVCAAKDAAKK